MAESAEMNELRDQLDALFIEFWGLFEQRTKHYEALGVTMKEGFWNLGRARYVMDSKVLSPVSYDMKMRASFIITDEQKGALAQAPVEWPDPDDDEYEQVDSGAAGKEGIKSEKTKELADESAHLRRRKGASEGAKEESIEPVEAGEVSAKSARNRDPLRWYGVLVPAHLRNCQSDFRKAVPELLELASITRRMLRVQDDYAQLLAKKTALQSKGSAADE